MNSVALRRRRVVSIAVPACPRVRFMNAVSVVTNRRDLAKLLRGVIRAVFGWGRCLLALHLPLLLLLLGPDCRKAAPPVASGPDPLVSQALGSNAAVTLVLRPQSWPEASRTLERLVESAFPTARSRILTAPTAWDAFAQIANDLAPVSGPSKLPRTLPGWDPTRPLVATIAETDPIDLSFFLRVLTRNSALASWPGLRHELRVPATDVGVLLESLKAVVQAFKPVVIEEDRDALSQRRILFAAGQPFESKLVGALVTDRNSVRVRLYTDCYHYDLERLRNGSSSDPLKQEHLSEFWARIEKTNAVRSARSKDATPALRAFLASRDPISAYLRTDRLRDISVLTRIAQPLNFLAPGRNTRDVRTGILSRVFADALATYGYLSLDSAEVEDWAIRLLVGADAQLEAIGSLTVVGARERASSPRLRAPVESPIVSPSVRELAMGELEQAISKQSWDSMSVLAAAFHFLAREPFSTLSAKGMGEHRFEALRSAIVVESSIGDGAFVASLRARAPWNAKGDGNSARPLKLAPLPAPQQCRDQLALALSKLLDGLAGSGDKPSCPPSQPNSQLCDSDPLPAGDIEKCPRCLQGLAETKAAVRCAVHDENVRDADARVEAALDALLSEWRGEGENGPRTRGDLPIGTSACGSDIGYQGRVNAVVEKTGELLMNAELATEAERADRYTTVEIDRNARFGAVMAALARIPYPTCELRFRQCWPYCHSDDLWCRGHYYAMFRRNRQGGYLGLSVHRSFSVAGHGFVPIKMKVSNGRVELECPPNGVEPWKCLEAKGSLESGLRTVRSVYPRATSLVLFVEAPPDMQWNKIASIIDQNYCFATQLGAFFVLGSPEREIWEQAISKDSESN